MALAAPSRKGTLFVTEIVLLEDTEDAWDVDFQLTLT